MIVICASAPGRDDNGRGGGHDGGASHVDGNRSHTWYRTIGRHRCCCYKITLLMEAMAQPMEISILLEKKDKRAKNSNMELHLNVPCVT